tara:strand:+ start:1281 stop:1481 length:201 start_codon:yes stop_codon:yes gene_type:complete
MLKLPEDMTFEELLAEYNELKLGFGGLRTKDIMRKQGLEDEIHYRETEGYIDLTPAEIKELEVDKD